MEDPAAVDALLDLVTRTLFAVREHQRHEDEHLVALLAQHDPHLAAEIGNGRRESQDSLRRVSRLVTELSAAGPQDRASLARLLSQDLDDLATRHARHLAAEQRAAETVLGSAATEADLATLGADIRDGVALPAMCVILEFLLPVMDAGDQRALLRSLSEAPPEVWNRLYAAARAALGDDED